MSTVVEDFTTFSPGLYWMGMSSGSVSGPVSLESAVTTLCSCGFGPVAASSSACVTVWTQLNVHVSTRPSWPSLLVSPVGPVGAASHIGSETVTPVRLMLPVLVTSKV